MPPAQWRRKCTPNRHRSPARVCVCVYVRAVAICPQKEWRLRRLSGSKACARGHQLPVAPAGQE
ncbi:tudor domain-containing protein 15-like protein [Anopheles sinensis]|uniref:Tudor domain-containing protein 15-like protein n=1 Tax=Anopheles sinensis TaxID=74873 RepID=A0A084W8M5_ANOSI|nr:tudor domain-containing protein 15-like protein [Anopheles sinensis]